MNCLSYIYFPKQQVLKPRSHLKRQLQKLALQLHNPLFVCMNNGSSYLAERKPALRKVYQNLSPVSNVARYCTANYILKYYFYYLSASALWPHLAYVHTAVQLIPESGL